LNGESDLRLSSTRGRWVLAITVLGSGIAFLEATVVNVALPELGRDLDADVAGLQWTINGYLITLASLILLGGSLGDRYGRRRIFEIGVVWFTLASALCALAPNIEILVLARVIQGVGGALLTPGSLAIIEATFRQEDRGRAIGAWSALTGVAGAVGPLVGGYLIDAVSWRAIFLINLPLGAFVVWASRRHIPETRDPSITGALDLRGSALATLGLGGLTFALIQTPDQGFISPSVLTALTVGIVSMVAFVRTEHRAPQPMLPLSIFSSRQFTSANLVTFVVYAALGAVFFLLVVFLQIALGYTAIEAGAASLPATAVMLLFSPSAGALAQRIGPRIPLTIGPILVAVGMFMMSEINVGDSYVQAVLPAVIVFGVGLTLVVAPVTITVLAAADPRQAGIASGVNNAVARTGGLLAVAVLPVIAGLSGGDYQDPTAIADGFEIGMRASAALAAAGGIIAFATISDDVLERAKEPERQPCQEALAQAPERHCAVAGTPLHSAGRPSATRRRGEEHAPADLAEPARGRPTRSS
jgi:EmrB/QacA subfamily drug resistance transporter